MKESPAHYKELVNMYSLDKKSAAWLEKKLKAGEKTITPYELRTNMSISLTKAISLSEEMVGLGLVNWPDDYDPAQNTHRHNETPGRKSLKNIIKQSAPFVRLSGGGKSGRRREYGGLMPELLFVVAVILSIIVWPGLHTVGNIVSLVLWLCILVLLFILAIDNVKSMLLRNTLLLPLGIVVVVYQLVNSIILNDVGVLGSAILGGIIVGGIPYLLFVISAGRWVGGGDPKLGLVVGLLLGWKFGILFVILAVALLLIYFIFEHFGAKIAHRDRALTIPTGVVWALSATALVLVSL
jgi:Flp pilus assembly protein protease CpaA